MTTFFAPDIAARMAARMHALSILFLSAPMQPSLHRIEDAFIGLSCLAIAATLGSFLATSDRTIPFRRTLIALTLCTTGAGIFSLLSIMLGGDAYPLLAGQATLLGVALAILTACLLPFLLPLLLSKARELHMTSLAARQSQTRFLAVTQSSTDAFMLLDTLRLPNGTIEDFRFTYVNPNAEKIIQLPGSRILGARLTRILPINPHDRLFQQFCQVILTGQPLIHEFPLDAKDPSSPWMRHHVARLGEDGEAGLAITASDITDRKHTEQVSPPIEIMADAQHDPLTGLPNRLLLDDRLQQAIARANRYGNRVAVMHVDIDGFQTVNEIHGRPLGDLILRALALRLRAAIRGTDSVLRIESDDFIVIMPDMRLEIDVRRAAATLVAILREPVVVEGRAIRLSCSLGVTAYPDTALTAPDILTAAAAALDRARKLGRNQYILHGVFAEPGRHAEPEVDVDFYPDAEPEADERFRHYAD